jgi:hypothetical protein
MVKLREDWCTFTLALTMTKLVERGCSTGPVRLLLYIASPTYEEVLRRFLIIVPHATHLLHRERQKNAHKSQGWTERRLRQTKFDLNSV